MPLPAILEEIIAARGDAFEPNAARQEYLDNRDLWQLYLDLYELDADKIMVLLDRHGNEDDIKYKLRQKMSAVFNYVPMVVRMAINYIYSEAPQIEVNDQQLQSFVDDCDGAGTSLAQYVRQTALPLSLVLGFIDVMVQNPQTPAGMFVTAADVVESADGITPRVLTITPLQRINWSTQPTHEYNWLAFVDQDDEIKDPFARGIPIDATFSAKSDISTPSTAGFQIGDVEFFGSSFIRVSRYLVLDDGQEIKDESGNEVGFWIRSWQEQDSNGSVRWFHDGGFLPTSRVPVATLYYVRSIDHTKRHFGMSKIAMIAILTRKIIQLLSWTDEDVLANLALFVLPGAPPEDTEGNPLPLELHPFKVIWVSNDARVPASLLQGSTDHIRVKMELIDAYTQEILRLAYIIGASAEAERVTSGVQGVVMRNELFMELADLALGCDNFVIDLLALAKAWIDNKDITRGEFLKLNKPTVSFYKGPYSIDPLADVIANTQQMLTMFEKLSPTMMRNLYRQLVMAATSNDNSDRDTIFNEIDRSLSGVIEENATQRALAMAAVAQAAAAPDNTSVAVDATPNNGEFGSATLPGA
jgi:hypothetical protein